MHVNVCMYVCVCVHVRVCVCMHVRVCAHTHECRYSERPEKGTEFRGVGVTGTCEQSIQVMGTKLRSSARTACALNHRALSSPSTFIFEMGGVSH